MYGRGLGYGPGLGHGMGRGVRLVGHAFFPGFGLLFGLLLVVSTALMVVAFWEILRKAGFDGPLALVMLVPGVSVIAMLVLAFVDWPVLRRLRDCEAFARLQQPAPDEASAVAEAPPSPAAPTEPIA